MNIKDEFLPDEIFVGGCRYVKESKIDRRVFEALEIYEVNPTYRLVRGDNGRHGYESFLSLSFQGMPSTKFKPGMMIAVTEHSPKQALP